MGLSLLPCTQQCWYWDQSPRSEHESHIVQNPQKHHPQPGTPCALLRVSIPPCPGSHPAHGSHPSLLGVLIHPCPVFPFPLSQDPHPSLPSVPTLAAGIPVPVPGASSHCPLRCRFCLQWARPGPSELGRAGTARPRCVIWGSRNAGPSRAGLLAQPARGTTNLRDFSLALLLICFPGLRFAVPAKYPEGTHPAELHEVCGAPRAVS